MAKNSKKIAVGLSGGVDSSVAAALLKQKGYRVIGVSMKIFDGAWDVQENERHACYGPGESEDIAATGHYARIEKANGRYLLKRATDASKDQSYFLYALTPDQLSHTIFPLGEFKKQDVRALAKSLGLQTADRPESQDFIAGGDYSMLFKDKEMMAGKIVDEGGKVLGIHRGIVNYTIGQRRGLGIASDRPLYVIKIDPQNHQVVVSDKENLVSKGLIANDINLIAINKLDRPRPVQVKIRLNQTAVGATVFPYQKGKIRILFDEPQLSVCPGQHAVLYSGDTVIGGGVIVEAV